MLKYISIIFDDGPNIFMNDMVDKFKKFGFKCGFAIIGRKINDETVPMLKYAIDNGFQLVSHGQTHIHLEQLSDLKDIENEIKQPIHTVERLLGYTIKMARLPFLSFDERVLNCAKELNLPLLGHGIDGGRDWSDDALPDDIAKAVINSACDGAVACLHVSERTLKALDDILPELKNRGFVLVNPTELFDIMNIKNIPLGIQIHNINDIDI